MTLRILCHRGSDSFVHDLARALAEVTPTELRLIDGDADIPDALAGASAVFVEWAGTLARSVSRMIPKGVPLVVRCHRYEVYEPTLDEIDWPRVDLCIVTSEHIRRRLVERVPGVRTVVIPSGVDLEMFRPPVVPVPLTSACVVGFIEPRKNPERWLTFLEASPGHTLSVAGRNKGCDFNTLAALRAHPRVTLHGWLPREEMPEFYARHHEIWSFSIDEGCPYNVIEAMACGLAVIPEFHSEWFLDLFALWGDEWLLSCLSPRDLAERHHDIRAHARTIAGLLEEFA